MSRNNCCAVLIAVTFAAATLVGRATADDQHRPAPRHTPGFEAFKDLAGEWVGKAPDGPHKGEEMHVLYKVTSGGTAISETMMPGTDHEMITMIHPDGDDLVLTHYCMLGNQPEMRSPDKLDGKDVAFKFVRAGNMKSLNEMHMHNVTYTFVDKDTLRSKWTHYMDGKASGDVMFELKRKK